LPVNWREIEVEIVGVGCFLRGGKKIMVLIVKNSRNENDRRRERSRVGIDDCICTPRM